jgi:hypothetical protein
VESLLAERKANVTVVCSGDVGACQEFLAPLAPAATRLIDAARTAHLRWHVNLLPFAFAIDSAGIARARGPVGGPASLYRIWNSLSDDRHEQRSDVEPAFLRNG